MFAHDAELDRRGDRGHGGLRAAALGQAQPEHRPDRRGRRRGRRGRAEAVTLVNTLLGMVMDTDTGRPVLGGGGGGLSGPAIHPVAVRAVYDVRAALPGSADRRRRRRRHGPRRGRAAARRRERGAGRHGDVRRPARRRARCWPSCGDWCANVGDRTASPISRRHAHRGGLRTDRRATPTGPGRRSGRCCASASTPTRPSAGVTSRPSRTRSSVLRRDRRRHRRPGLARSSRRSPTSPPSAPRLELDGSVADIRDAQPRRCSSSTPSAATSARPRRSTRAEAFVRYGADAVTVNPYLGADSVEPFLPTATAASIVLCRTLEPGRRRSAGPARRRSAAVRARRPSSSPRAGTTTGNAGSWSARRIPPSSPGAQRSSATISPLLVPGVGAQGGDAGRACAPGPTGTVTGWSSTVARDPLCRRRAAASPAAARRVAGRRRRRSAPVRPLPAGCLRSAGARPDGSLLGLRPWQHPRSSTPNSAPRRSQGRRGPCGPCRAQGEAEDGLGRRCATRSTQADSDDVVGKLKVVALLESLPGVGKVKARQVMEEIGIAETRRVEGLGAQQRQALLEQLGK